MAIQRNFQTIPEGKLNEADQQFFLVSLGWSRAIGWEELLRSKRVLIISEAGAGKTYECYTQYKMLRDAGEPSFFLELATLATSDLRSTLDYEEEARLDAWIGSQSDVATFFLDSIDELKLSRGSFEMALKRLNKIIAGQLGRTRIVITTRPIPFDEQLVHRLLPVPPLPDVEANGEMFAQKVMHGFANKQKASHDDKNSADWRTVALMPLSDEQIMEFARDLNVEEPKILLEDLRRRNAQEFARRPQDLIELCADWRASKSIRTHKEQVEANIRIKLNPRQDRPEPAELSVEKAIDGASRMALAMMVTRRLTIRHSAEADVSREDVALDPATILSDWNANEHKALLERPLFGFASYGRVRFHHRSAAEYLAAKRLLALRTIGMPVRELKRLIFADTKGCTIVRPSKRPIAGWLALNDDMIFETLRDHEPAVLLSEGDPESLMLHQRVQALRAYVERYGNGGWRGLSVPQIQIHRFASPELAAEINRLWGQGIENPEIRELLLDLIAMGRIAECSDIAYETAQNSSVSRAERLAALNALATINDPRLDTITVEIAANIALWPDDLARGAVLRLFPGHLTIARLCQILARVREKNHLFGDLNWQLPWLIADADLDDLTLEALRDGLYILVTTGLQWQKDWPHIISDHPDLSSALAAVCVRGLKAGTTTDWLRSSALALRLPHSDNGGDGVFKQLKQMIAALPAEQNEKLFWAEDSLIQSIHPIADPWPRFAEIAFRGAVQIDRCRDLEWIKAALADSARLLADRAMLLEAAMSLAPSLDKRRAHIIGLKPLAADRSELLTTIEDRLKPSKYDKENKLWEIEEEKRKEKQKSQDAKDHASWVLFWREVAEQPDTAFSPEKSGDTAWNLWCAMSWTGNESRTSGWNRRFIETYFGKEIADRLRLTLINQWRNDRPTLTSERPDDCKNTTFVRWQLGLAAIYAEAEDPEWAIKLTEEEARIAARYAPINSDLPLWMESLVCAHPAAVDATLGYELSLELKSEASAHWNSMLLQSIGYAPDPVIALFLPRLCEWLDANGGILGQNEDQDGAARRLKMVVDILIKHGDSKIREQLLAVAQKRCRDNVPTSIVFVWLPTLMRLDACSGVDALEKRIKAIEPAEHSDAVSWFSTLFGDLHDGISLAEPQFTPSILLRLLRLSYRHIRLKDDVKHDGVYSPNTRDHAEHARNAILNTLLNANGEEGWAAKMDMAADPLFAHFKDRILAVAEEHWAEEIDAVVFDDIQAILLDRTGEAPPSSNEAMFAVMENRLSDIDDLLLRDVSPREAWAKITDERVMRREIARELRHLANDLYKIDQEAVTADEKETDIRLRSTTSDYEAIIELKLADKNYSVRELRDTLKDQLVTKYMASESSRSGCLMITLAKDKTWRHPDNNSRIEFGDLVDILRREARSIEESLGGTLRLHVHALDFRPRLSTEAKSKSNKLIN